MERVTTRMSGTLYLVATPIGNRGDITLRAVDTLKSVDIIAAEDTRRAGLLLKDLEISKPLLSCFDSNERARVDQILAELQTGKSLALISDAGSPLINDPGYVVVSACYAAGIKVEIIPGACAVIAALSLSGVAAYPFTFIGFFPRPGGKRSAILKSIAIAKETLVMFESPRRLKKTIADLGTACSKRKIVVLREITKTYEERIAGTAEEVTALIAERDIKGEIVIVIEGRPSDQREIPDDNEFQRRLARGESPRDIATAMKAAGFSKSKAYQRALILSNNS